MSTTIIVVLAVSFLFGGMVLMLAMGYTETEQQRAAEAQQRRAEAALQTAAMVALPGFFAAPRAAAPSTFVVFDDAMVNRLEHHVRLEQAMVAQFVHHPSLDNLYRHPTTPVHVH
jgi:flagellar basal body-associated protein FliL